MAKKGNKKGKKKGGKRGGSKKKGRSRSRPKKHLGADIGLAVTAYKVATDKEGTNISPVEAVFYPYADTKTKIEAIVRKTVSNLMETKNTGPALVGLTLSFGEDIPVVGGLFNDFFKKPVNRMLGKLETALTHKKRKWWL